jgi:hypothetical protein
MPQHPTYSNSPVRDINRLSNLLAELISFGIVHEDIYSNIDKVMFELYRERCTKSEVQNKSLDTIGDDDDDYDDDEAYEYEDSLSPTSSELFDAIPVDDRPQYIQDLRNTIAHCMFSGTWSTEGVSDQIASLRDIEYYNYGVQVVEDTEVLEKYQYKPRSIWFPSEITPIREGIYEISSDESNPKHSGFAYWDGRTWSKSCILLDDCIDKKKSSENKISWNYCWRGFSEPQKPS